MYSRNQFATMEKNSSLASPSDPLAKQRSEAAKQMLYALSECSILYLTAPDKHKFDPDDEDQLDERMLRFNTIFPVRSQVITKDSMEQEVMDEYLDNIPVWLKTTQLERITRAALGPKEYRIESSTRNWYTNWMERLEHVGIFRPKVIASYTGEPKSPIFARAFQQHGLGGVALGTALGLYEILAATGINPFVYREGEFDKHHELLAGFTVKAAHHCTLLMVSQPGVKLRLDQLKKEFVEQQQKRQKEALPLSETDSEFTLKLSQPVENLEVDGFSFDREKCPLWSAYQISKLVGYGSYGFVCKFTRGYRSDNSKLENYAIKFQRFAKDEDDPNNLMSIYSAPYVELRISYEVNRRLKHMSSKQASFANVIRLHDWVKCQVDPRKRFMLSLTKDQIDDKHLLNMLAQSEYQITVSEFAEDGSLDAFLKSSTGSFNLFTRGAGFASLLVQVFGTMLSLHKSIGFVHHDCKSQNLLVQPIDPRAGIDYLVYKNIPGGALYVPVSATGFRVVKIGDMGMSRMELSDGRIIANKVDWFSSIDNPAHDLQDFAIFLLWDMITSHMEVSKNTVANMEKTTLKKLASMIQKNWDTDASDQALETRRYYGAILGVLNEWIKTDGPKRNVSDDRLLLMERYISQLYHAREWVREVKKKDLTAYEDLFDDRMFDVFRTRPADLTEANSVVADDFRVPTSTTTTAGPSQSSGAESDTVALKASSADTAVAVVGLMRLNSVPTRDSSKNSPIAAEIHDKSKKRLCLHCGTNERKLVSSIGHQIGFFCSQECSDQHWTKRLSAK